MTPRERRKEVRKAKDFTIRRLKAIAEGPIMDPLRIYCPAGKLTPAEARKRDRYLIRIENVDAA